MSVVVAESQCLNLCACALHCFTHVLVWSINLVRKFTMPSTVQCHYNGVCPFFWSRGVAHNGTQSLAAACVEKKLFRGRKTMLYEGEGALEVFLT